MAWKKSRAYKYARRRVMSSRVGMAYSYGGKRGAGKALLGMSLPYMAGVVFGMTNYDDIIPMNIKLGVAVAPGNIIPAKIQSFAKGTVMGNLIQAQTGFTLGGNLSSQTNGSISF